MKKRICGCLFWISGAVMLCLLTGCLAGTAKHLKDDPASLTVRTPWGTLERWVPTNAAFRPAPVNVITITTNVTVTLPVTLQIEQKP